jgi:hypothetical protein
MLKKLGQTSNWSVVPMEPPKAERDVFHSLDENDVTVLITDWRLNEGSKGQRVVNYEADRLIAEIRQRRPTFPIFVVTGYKGEANAHLRHVEGVYDRTDLANGLENILPQMLRAGQRRFDEQREMLARADVLARRVAAGKATADERKELNGLQGLFQAELPTLMTLDGVLSEFTSIEKRANTLLRKVKSRIAKSKRKG